jgi:AAA family ATP:ADP antiporter
MTKTKARAIRQSLLDVRSGEYRRTVFMALYLFFVMVAYYILKPVSAAMFLHKLGADDLPYLYMLTALCGGLVSYFYTKAAVNSSLLVAVTWAMAVAVVCLVVLWRVIGMNLGWMLYAFNVWVSLFSIVLVSQGWMVASNVFDTREAKRLYGLLGLGAVIGSGVGAMITKGGAKRSGAPNLILVSAVMVALAYIAFRLAIRQKRETVAQAKGAREHVAFSSRDIVKAMVRQRHLRIMIAIILVMFVVDETTDYQFNYMAHARYSGRDALTAFIATFYLYMSVVSFCLQFFLTGWVVRRIGVGGTLKVAPVSMALLSTVGTIVPGLGSAVLTKFWESLNRYTINKTAMELLYLPLPADLRNRTKAFMDIFVDRSGRGIAGVLLSVLVWLGFGYPRFVAALTVLFAVLWLALAHRAQKEYLTTVKSRLERRRLELESASVPVNDPAMTRLLEQTAESGQPRQVCYALTLLAETPDYELNSLLEKLAASAAPQIRAKVYELAWFVVYDELIARALEEIRGASRGEVNPALKPAVNYVLAFSGQAEELAREFLDHVNTAVAESALESMKLRREWARELIEEEWLNKAAHDEDAQRRYVAAVAIGVLGEEGSIWLPKLLADRDTSVVMAACRSAGVLRNRACVESIIRRLADPRVRAVAIESLAAYGTSITGFLGDFLMDETVAPAIRRQIPRALKLVNDQRSVDVLLKSIAQEDLSVRAAVLRALGRLREAAPQLNYGEIFVTEQILAEARHYYELYAALEPFQDQKSERTAAGLLQRGIEERLKQTLERLFRLLGLRYQPVEMHSAWLAVNHRRKEQFLAALEFLDTVLEPRLKRVLLPMLDSTEQIAERGRSLFGLEVRDAETAVRELLRSGDPWLTACAAATAAERRLERLAPEIAALGQRSGTDVSRVARSAAAVLGVG